MTALCSCATLAGAALSAATKSAVICDAIVLNTLGNAHAATRPQPAQGPQSSAESQRPLLVRNATSHSATLIFFVVARLGDSERQRSATCMLHRSVHSSRAWCLRPHPASPPWRLLPEELTGAGTQS